MYTPKRLLRLIHQFNRIFKSNAMDHKRISGIGPLLVSLGPSNCCKNSKNDARKMPKHVEAKGNGVITHN